ncbi:uncharacterized protein LOC105699959 [Orussus abietinus]|uniref:uncharacterized protein LOC105699959 n=1 Tax=Orussus abietinus TaxID=222816 RepID=UPI000C715F5C|nr:uncharacterized protein LOC105699959 [Orussus abietinus]
MDNNYRINIGKWLPLQNEALEKWFEDSHTLNNEISDFLGSTTLIINDLSTSDKKTQELCKLLKKLETILDLYKIIQEVTIPSHVIYKYRVHHVTMSLKKKINVTAKLMHSLICHTIEYTDEECLQSFFRLVNAYNGMLDLKHDVFISSINRFHNDCPRMLEPLKKMSFTHLLQILAKNKSEKYCQELLVSLMANYKPSKRKKEVTSPESGDVEISENSSVEIYRALTKNITPPTTSNSAPELEDSNIESIRALVNTQNEEVNILLNIAKDISPRLLGPEALKTEEDETRVRRTALKRVINYYQEVAWVAVSTILDHIILWWSAGPFTARHRYEVEHLNDWLHRFTQRADVPSNVRSILQNLRETLAVHITVTVWDRLFRTAYTSAFECQSKRSSIEGTDTGRAFVEVFQLLVGLANEGEISEEWTQGAPLAELPLSEQILVLHRLDHSVHTMRLWAMRESTAIAHSWDLDSFFLVVHGDLVNCSKELSYLKLANHTNSLEVESLSVQVFVCAKMRVKIVSEVNANVSLLKNASSMCIDTLAKICRVVSLANLHMCFPRPAYWRKNRSVAPSAPSPYVKTFFENVLLPVLEVMEDHEIPNMILKIMCEAWLDYIYLHRIKFSKWGALQLLTDFAFVTNWVTECSIISQNIRNHLVKNEVLRRCEGVGRLLLRHPGETISMFKQPVQKTGENGSPESIGLERMPAEMYVPNQEQWLELRAPNRYSFCCTE